MEGVERCGIDRFWVSYTIFSPFPLNLQTTNITLRGVLIIYLVLGGKGRGGRGEGGGGKKKIKKKKRKKGKKKGGSGK
ncbi:hypothetical protein O5699_00140 [Escherichia coli]|nr:hypothetical protein [Escherichia coli]